LCIILGLGASYGRRKVKNDQGGLPAVDRRDPLRLSEARLNAFASASSDIIFRVSPDWSELRAVDGRGIVADITTPARNWIDAYVAAEDQPRFRAAIDRAIRTRCLFEITTKIHRLDGSTGWVLSRAVPMIETDGEIYEWYGTAADITERHEMELEVARLTDESERQRRLFESLISATPDLVYAFDTQYRFTFANEALLEMWGRTLEDSVGKRLLEVGYEPWHAAMHEREIDQVIATKAGIRGEVGFPHSTLGWRVYDYIFMPVFDVAGEVVAIAGSTRDISDIKRSEEHLRLLVNELNHRVKNTLATIQSLARQTFRGDQADPAARAAFDERLIALSNAHTVLTRKNWESVGLREIAGQALAPFGSGYAEAERFCLEGDDLPLAPRVALALAMALHELASNAVKYGALSTEHGRVRLHCARDGDTVRCVWREEGGPPVRPPRARGFGSRLLEVGLARELGGAVRLEFPADGVVCTIEFPAAQENPREPD